MARLKRVFDNAGVAHQWVHPRESDDHGRSNNGQFYFVGPTIYSYGNHFPVAMIREYKNKPFVFYNGDSYSISTSRHQSLIRQAIPNDWIIFSCDTVEIKAIVDSYPQKTTHNWIRHIFKGRRKKLNKLIKDINRPRARQGYGHIYFSIIYEIENLQAYGFEYELPEWFMEDYNALSAKREERERKREERSKEQTRIRALQEKERIPLWRAGEYNGSMYNVPVMFRIKDNEVQSSQGARFPKIDAIREWPEILRGYQKTRGTESPSWIPPQPIRLGSFTVDRFTSEGIIAGCHSIKWFEVFRGGRLLDLVS